MKYKVKIGGNNSFYGLNSDEFEEGECVKFTVPHVSDASTKVTSEDVILKRVDSDGYGSAYCFSMPGKDVSVEISITGDMLRVNTEGSAMGMMGMGASGMLGSMAEFQQNFPNMVTFQQSGMAATQGKTTEIINRKFCRDCGAKLEKENQAFCQECGAKQED